MTAREITLEILKSKQEYVESYRETREYAGWSCGQQDAENEADDHFDRLMALAIEVHENKSVYWNISGERRFEMAKFIGEIIQEFTEESAKWLANY